MGSSHLLWQWPSWRSCLPPAETSWATLASRTVGCSWTDHPFAWKWSSRLSLHPLLFNFGHLRRSLCTQWETEGIPCFVPRAPQHRLLNCFHSTFLITCFFICLGVPSHHFTINYLLPALRASKAFGILSSVATWGSRRPKVPGSTRCRRNHVPPCQWAPALPVVLSACASFCFIPAYGTAGTTGEMWLENNMISGLIRWNTCIAF